MLVGEGIGGPGGAVALPQTRMRRSPSVAPASSIASTYASSWASPRSRRGTFTAPPGALPRTARGSRTSMTASRPSISARPSGGMTSSIRLFTSSRAAALPCGASQRTSWSHISQILIGFQYFKKYSHESPPAPAVRTRVVRRRARAAGPSGRPGTWSASCSSVISSVLADASRAARRRPARGVGVGVVEELANVLGLDQHRRERLEGERPRRRPASGPSPRARRRAPAARGAGAWSRPGRDEGARAGRRGSRPRAAWRGRCSRPSSGSRDARRRPRNAARDMPIVPSRSSGASGGAGGPAPRSAGASRTARRMPPPLKGLTM